MCIGSARKPRFEETLPPAAIGKLVRADMGKEAVLTRVYGVEVTGAMIEAESAQTLGVASLSLPKRSYEEWLAQQPA